MPAKKKPAPKKATQKRSKQSPDRSFESDGTYFLKLVVVALFGMFWVRFEDEVHWGSVAIIALPVGLLLGLLAVSKFEHYQSDRKIWYAVLLIVTIVSYFLPTGLIL